MKIFIVIFVVAYMAMWATMPKADYLYWAVSSLTVAFFGTPAVVGMHELIKLINNTLKTIKDGKRGIGDETK